MSKSEPLTNREVERMRVTPDLLSGLVRNRRGALRMTREQFANRLHVHPTTIKRWEEGKFDPTTVRLANILFAQDPANNSLVEMWMRRALTAEGALQLFRTVLERVDRKNGHETD